MLVALFIGCGAGALAQEFGPAPQWLEVEPPVEFTEPAKSSLAVNTTNRVAVVDFFNTVYRASEGFGTGWSGNRATCTAGTNATVYSEATLRRVNYFRAMTGLPGDVAIEATRQAPCLEAALMMSAQGALSHSPPTTWACYTSAGAGAAGKSNLALGTEGPSAINGYIDDPGSNNYFVGHRRWILYPPQLVLGTGSIPSSGGWVANVLWVIGNFGSRPAQPAWVAWPPKGFVPYQVLPASSKRWSFSYAGADFANASVTMTRAGAPVTLTTETQVNDAGYADNTIVWIPQGVPTTKPAADITYSVTLTNVRVNGSPRTFTYDVTIIDPDAVVTVPLQLRGRLTNETSFAITWPTNAGALRLHSTAAFAPVTTWTPVLTAPVRQGNEFSVTVLRTNSQQFFRLQP